MTSKRLIFLFTLLFSITACTAIPTDGSAAGAVPRPVMIYVAKRHGLNLRIGVRGERIVSITAGAALRCAGGGRSGGSEEYDSGLALPIAADGSFHTVEFESPEGAGAYYSQLQGRVTAHRIVGTYTEWEQERRRSGFEEPRCGTLSPRGLPLRFVARLLADRPEG